MTDKQTEALNLALEALEKLVRFESDSWEIGSCRVAGQAIKTLREALAEQPAQHRAWFTVDELSAWADKKLKENPQWAEQPAQVDPCIDGSCSCCWAQLDEQPAQQTDSYVQQVPDKCDRIVWRGSYYHLPLQPAQQGQVAWTLLLTGEHHGLVGKAGEKFVGHPEHYARVDVYTSPRRTWVELTDEEIQDCCATTLTPFGLQQARALLDKFKEKNA